MEVKLSAFTLDISFFYQKQNVWIPVPDAAIGENGFTYETEGASYCASWQPAAEGLDYRLGFDAPYETQLRMRAALVGGQDLYHLIPCNIYGDNHAAEAKPGEYPLLTEAHREVAFCASRWEFRADRAAAPFSALCCNEGAVALSINPYSDTGEGGYIRNGVFAELPNAFGVTLGYTNDPVTFTNKTLADVSTRHTARKAEAEGTLFAQAGAGRQAVHAVVRALYGRLSKRPGYEKTYRQAATGILESLAEINYDREAGEFTNCNCQPPAVQALTPWRHVTEIGWTGGGVLAYPMVLCRDLLGEEGEALLAQICPGEKLFDRICEAYNEKSGLLNDLMPSAKNRKGPVNGWWTDYGLVKDCHCAYNVGSAVHYMLKTMAYYKAAGKPVPQNWLDTCRRVLGTVVELQRADGAFGYTYSTEKKRVLDWSGFAGCWFAPALVYLHRLTGEAGWLDAAKKALRFYQGFVQDLNCFATPMDTWKSVDQEGNLAFIRGCRLVHEETGEAEFLEYLVQGANYEFLWRYAYPTRPEYTPLAEGWNACGGSVTSVSNPHIHPMGVIVDSDLWYLADATGDAYYAARAADSTAWLMQCLECYPDRTGYGRYGVMSERWCPSDGLTVQRYSDGRPYSSWFSYNLWAVANALETVCERMLDAQKQNAT